MNITDFLLIGDKKGFNLWVPRVNFWHRMLAKALGAQMGLWEKELMMMDGTVLKADHSRKAAKLIRIKGVRLFKAIYTLMNGEGRKIRTSQYPSRSIANDHAPASRAVDSR